MGTARQPTSFRHGLPLLMLGLAQIALAANAAPLPAFLLCWSGISWVIAGSAYLGLGIRVFGKRNDGRLAWISSLILLPYLGITWLLWFCQTRLTREPVHNEIVPGLWLGRRCFAHELPAGIETVVDLTAEFGEPTPVRQGRRYICTPALDASVPDREAFEQLVQTAADAPRPVYVHCALGHGRSATAVVALLVACGEAQTLEEAEQIVKAARPGIGIKPLQKKLLNDWFSYHSRR